MTQATFYFDLGSPYAYLVAERLAEVLPEPVAWQPVSLGGLFKANGRSSWGLGDPARRQEGMVEVESRARALRAPARALARAVAEQLPVRDARRTFAFQQGRGREFTVRAFRHAFQQGHDLGVPERVLDVAAEVGLDPHALEAASSDPDVKQALRAATDAAHELGVFGVPTVAVGDELFWGDDRLQDAVAALG